jgi:hypothetical protein
MGVPGQFEGQKGQAMDCAALEALLAEAVEGALPEELASAVAAHGNACAACRQMLEQARQGREWLLLLQQESIAVPAGLVEAVLARTSGATILAAELPVPGMAPAGVGAQMPRRRPAFFAFHQMFLEPRLVLTAAMAFFSISLTLNMLGVRLTNLRPANFSPQELRRVLTRQYVQANTQVVRYYENLRFVYEVESRVQELRRAAEMAAPEEQEEPKDQQKQTQQKQGGASGNGPQGTSEGAQRHKGPLAGAPRTKDQHPSIQGAPVRVPMGPLVDASLQRRKETGLPAPPLARTGPAVRKGLKETRANIKESASWGQHPHASERSAV